jgi:ComF family protein
LGLLTSRAREVEAFAMPRACLGCERPMPPRDTSACCALCRHRMRGIAPPVCPRCGQPRDPWSLRLAAGVGRACAFCREWPRELDWAASAVWLEDGPARNLVHALKYGGWRLAAPAMAERMAAVLAPRLRDLDALVPVPLGRARERERGHNQAALLAEALGRLAGTPVVLDALRRTRETRSQTRLSPAQRRRNVAGAFAAAGRGLAGRRVAVVDDVMTTGATLGAAAEALAALGPASIGAVTFARALVPA